MPHPSPRFFYPGVRTWCAHLEVILTRLWGRAVRLRTHCTVYVCICVCVCPEGVMWSGPQMLLITNSWRDPASTNRTSCWPWHQEEGGALMLGLFIYYALLILKMWVSKMFWQNLNSAWRRASILAPAQCRAVQLSQMSLLLSVQRNPLCSCEGPVVLWRPEDATEAGMQAGMHAPPPPCRPITKILKMISSH